VGAARYDLVFERGASYPLSLIWQDGDGTAKDLTGYTAKLQIRSSKGDSASSPLSERVSPGTITLGGAAGTVSMHWTPTETAAMTAGEEGWYDLLLTAGDGTVTRLLEGAATVQERVTQ
jgi:hypothetical protein